MKILFSGRFPLWLTLFLFILAVASVFWMYRRQSLRRPWSIVLPGLRIAALAALFAALLEPVLSRQRRKTVRGNIAILLDDSGSMSVTDTYSAAEKVQTAWHMGLFARDLRCMAFQRALPAVEEIARTVADITAGLEKTTLVLNSANRQISAERIRSHADRASALVDAIRTLADGLSDEIGEAGYLSLGTGLSVRKGHLSYERFEGIDGWQVSDLNKADTYPDDPDASALVSEFRMPSGVGERYGARLRGILKPPVSGPYTFWIAGDDQAVLVMAEAGQEDQAEEIARVPYWVEPGKFEEYKEQKSVPIVLDRDNSYYLAALLKENVGGDHCTVGWDRPDGRREFPIPGIYFSPIGHTVERERFNTDFGDFQGLLEQQARECERAVERLSSVLDQGSEESAASSLAQVRDEFRRHLPFWQQAIDSCRNLQRRADEVLAVAGLESVDTALTKLSNMSRAELGRHLLMKGALKIPRLRRLGDVRVFSLAEPPREIPLTELANEPIEATRPFTRLGSVVYEIISEYGSQPLAAVLMLTDGNSNAGRPLAEVGELLSELDIAALAIGIGLPSPPHDVSIDRILAPSTSFRGDRLELRTVVRRHGFRHRQIRLTVTSGGQLVYERVLAPGPEELVTVDLSFVEEHDGFRHYVVEAEAMGGEALYENNRRTVSVNILTDPIRVVMIDQFPRWETRYASMMLERDPRVEVRTFFAGNPAVAGAADTGAALPLSREELFVLDILILGDLPAGLMSEDQLLNIRSFVVDSGGCLMIMAGINHMPRSLRETPLADLMPFQVAPDAPAVGASTDQLTVPVHLRVTEAGHYSAPVQLAETASRNDDLWRRLPALDWVVSGVHATRNAEVLVTEEQGRPVLISSNAGLGRVLFVGADSFWRWRYRTGWRFHRRLWAQIFLWATVGRTTGIDEHVKLITDRPEYSPGETVTLRARVLGRDKLPLEQGTVSATILNDRGDPVKRVRFLPLEDSGGEYRARIRGLPRGSYVAVPRVAELEDIVLRADYPFEIRDIPTSEYVDLALDEGALAILADEYWPLLEAGQALEKIPEVRFLERRRSDVEIWDTLGFMLVVTLLLAAEWHLRKQLNLV